MILPEPELERRLLKTQPDSKSSSGTCSTKSSGSSGSFEVQAWFDPQEGQEIQETKSSSRRRQWRVQREKKLLQLPTCTQLPIRIQDWFVGSFAASGHLEVWLSLPRLPKMSSSFKIGAHPCCPSRTPVMVLIPSKYNVALLRFLESHGFSSDVCEPRAPAGCMLFRVETLYPIHVAAEKGECEVVRMLIAAGADPSQRTSRGRTAVDFAVKSKSPHTRQVLELLRSQGPVLCLRDAVNMMQNLDKYSFDRRMTEDPKIHRFSVTEKPQ